MSTYYNKPIQVVTGDTVFADDVNIGNDEADTAFDAVEAAIAGIPDNVQVALNTTHRSSDGTDHANVVLNDTHRTSDGTGHADVVTNTADILAHTLSTGDSHSDVVLNSAHRSGDGVDHSLVNLNRTHSLGDGSDHVDVASNTAARHNEAHTVASHSDTTATGAELETLTDTSNADSLHKHQYLSEIGGGVVVQATSTELVVAADLLMSGYNIEIESTAPVFNMTDTDEVDGSISLQNNVGLFRMYTELDIGSSIERFRLDHSTGEVLIPGILSVGDVNGRDVAADGDKLDTVGIITLDEGNGDGLVISGRDPSDYGNIGLRAVDLSYNPGVSSTAGATGESSFSSGYSCISSNYYSASFNQDTKASGSASFSTGSGTIASGIRSFTGGYFTTASYTNQACFGSYNLDLSTTIFEVGVGINGSSKANALEVHRDGGVVMPGLPTADPVLAGALWNNSGVLNISAG